MPAAAPDAGYGPAWAAECEEAWLADLADDLADGEVSPVAVSMGLALTRGTATDCPLDRLCALLQLEALGLSAGPFVSDCLPPGEDDELPFAAVLDGASLDRAEAEEPEAAIVPSLCGCPASRVRWDA